MVSRKMEADRQSRINWRENIKKGGKEKDKRRMEELSGKGAEVRR